MKLIKQKEHDVDTVYIDEFSRANRNEAEWWKLAGLCKKLDVRMVGADSLLGRRCFAARAAQLPKRLLLAKQGMSPKSIVEPTCGLGSFLTAALDTFPDVQSAIGLEINSSYAKTRFSSKRQPAEKEQLQTTHRLGCKDGQEQF